MRGCMCFGSAGVAQQLPIDLSLDPHRVTELALIEDLQPLGLEAIKPILSGGIAWLQCRFPYGIRSEAQSQLPPRPACRTARPAGHTSSRAMKLKRGWSR